MTGKDEPPDPRQMDKDIRDLDDLIENDRHLVGQWLTLFKLAYEVKSSFMYVKDIGLEADQMLEEYKKRVDVMLERQGPLVERVNALKDARRGLPRATSR
jgi:hypothetical protein